MLFLPAVQPTTPATASAWALAFFEGKLVLPEGEAIELHPHDPALHAALYPSVRARHYIGRLDGIDCWALSVAEAPFGWRALPLRTAMMKLAAPLSAVVGRAAQILEWDRTHAFCGACGTPTVLHAADRARTCPACNHVAYPRITPAMMVLVWRGRELLLARSPHYAPGMFSALAGFVEAGESLEDCVHREVAEEVSVQVTDLSYFGSQSWPFPTSLMVAYTARWVSGEIVPQAGEIEAAGWFDINELPVIPPARFSISGYLIRETVSKLRDGTL
jgi:NAD+ diphosphatase